MTTAGSIDLRVGIVEDPCACLPPAPPEVAAFLERMRAARADGTAAPIPTPDLLAQYNAWMSERGRLDPGDLCRYAAANAALPPPGVDRVVFIGDSITEGWGLYDPDLFKRWVNRGISGQTTPQILGRFRADGLNLKPRLIHLLAGTNDIAGNTGPTTLPRIEDNIRSMTELARASGVPMVLGSITPAAGFNWRPEIESRAPIAKFNAWLRDYAADMGATYADYHAALTDGDGGLRAELSGDGVHPNARGYAIMSPIAKAAVEAALGSLTESGGARRQREIAAFTANKA